MTTLDLLQAQISEEDFNAVWVEVSPPYESFLQLVSERLPGTSQQLTATARLHGRNRIRVDGELVTTGKERRFYVELVWLPTFQIYRHGGAGISEKPPEIQPKTIAEFIRALDAIVNEDELILAAQAFNAGEGVDEDDPDLPCSFPAIFALFERFPDEYFESPEMLLPLLEDRGGYEEALVQSLTRKPSLAAVTLLGRLLCDSPPPEDTKRWLAMLTGISQSTKPPGIVCDLAREILDHYEDH